jgi:hypothetical protein
MTNVNDIYVETCDAFLEPNGLQLGLITEADFLKFLFETLSDFLMTGLIWKMVCLEGHAGQTDYIEPDQITDISEAFWNDGFLNDTSSFSLDNAGSGEEPEPGNPEAWYEDHLPVKRIRVLPPPDVEGFQVGVTGAGYGLPAKTSAANDFDVVSAPGGPYYGTVAGAPKGAVFAESLQAGYGIPANIVPSTGNLKLVGTAIPTILTLTLDTPIEFVPDSFIPYLKWGVLEKIHSVDGEAKNLASAKYAAARYLEGKNLVNAIFGEPTEA